ncbi:hypothetical protein WMW72_28725 [Paenibacillus filicis]|uniref:Uncharacterized protein n=1 Tax=Paenibacillus filicis TaxID=669464 RepID=A0ABU9DSP6_9BACL
MRCCRGLKEALLLPGNQLSIREVYEVACLSRLVMIPEEAMLRVGAARRMVFKMAEQKRAFF